MKVKIKDNKIYMGEKNKELIITFQRTLRVPDDGKIYPLPSSCGKFPVKKIEDYKENVPNSWLMTGGVFIPMYQLEALWINFDLTDHYHPKAVKIATGKICTVTGNKWKNQLSKEQDYYCVPPQKWSDGFNSGEGYINQYVAMPLKSKYTVERQVTGMAKHGGLQIIMYGKKENREWLIYDEFLYKRGKGKFGSFPSANQEMGVSKGGRIKQKVNEDTYGFDSWDQSKFARVYVRIVNSLTYKKITGEDPPISPITKDMYDKNGLKWFDLYEENIKDVGKSKILKGVKTVKEVDKNKYAFPQQDDDGYFIKKVKKLYNKIF